MKHSKAYLVGQWFLLISVTIVALAAAGTSMVLSVSFGLKLGVVIAIVFGLADFMKVFIPLSSYAQGGMSGKQKAVWVVAVALAVIAAGSHLLEKQGARFQHALSSNRVVTNTRADQDRLRARLAEIKETMAVSAARDLALTTGKSLTEAKAAVKKLGIECALRKTCNAIDVAHTAAKQRLADAEARDALQAELAAIKTDVAQDTVETAGAGAQLGVMLGTDAARTSGIIEFVLAALALLFLEVLAAYAAVEAGKRIGAMAKLLTTPTIKVKVSVCDPTQGMSKDEILRAVQAAYLAAEEMPSTRQLAKRFGKSNSTLAGWIVEWKEKGLLPQKPTKLRVVS